MNFVEFQKMTLYRIKHKETGLYIESSGRTWAARYDSWKNNTVLNINYFCSKNGTVYFTKEGVEKEGIFGRDNGSFTIQHEVDHNLGILITDYKN